MHTLVNNLKVVLQLLAEIHEKLLEAAERKRAVIIEGDLDGMETLLNIERELLGAVERAETQRKDIIDSLTRKLGITGEAPKLVDLIEKIGGEEAKLLLAIRARLRNVLDKLRYRNRQNGELLKVSITHVNEFLKLVADNGKGSPMYGRDGKRTTGQLRTLDKSA